MRAPVTRVGTKMTEGGQLRRERARMRGPGRTAPSGCLGCPVTQVSFPTAGWRTGTCKRRCESLVLLGG